MAAKKTLRTLRKQNKWSQAHLAEKMGVSQYAVSRWEQNPEYLLDTAFKHVLRITEIFDITVADIDMEKKGGV